MRHKTRFSSFLSLVVILTTILSSIHLPTVSQYQLLGTPLLPNTAYYWKVQTKAVNGPSSWSQPFHFTTGP